MIKNIYFQIISGIMLLSISCKSEPLPTVANVDLNKYAGKWYEIASFPQSFQKGCCATTAEYTLSEKGYVIVSCPKIGLH